MYINDSPLLDPYIFYSNRNEYWFFKVPLTDQLFGDFPEEGKYMNVSGVRMQVLACLQKNIFGSFSTEDEYYHVYLVG